MASVVDIYFDGCHGLERAYRFQVYKKVADANACDYRGLVLPGGVANPDALRVDKHAVAFVKAFFEQKKTVAAICHPL